MMTLDEIQSVVKHELQEFEPYFRRYLQSPVPMLAAIADHTYRTRGKQLRPLLVLLSAKLNGEVGQSAYVGAAMMELLHTATLMHDDVVDEADSRRGRLSVNALFDSKTAVLAGDFLLSRGALVALDYQNTDFLNIAVSAIRHMSEGELLQMDKARRLDRSEELYFDIIRKKTALLLQSCTMIGAHSVGAAPQQVQAMGDYGERLGMAFQLRDDVLDFHSSGLTGKACGNDIREKKITLPLIYALQQVGEAEQGRVVALVANAEGSSSKVKQVVQFVQEHGGLAYADNVTRRYCRHAMQALDPYPESPAKQALCGLAEYVAERKK
ncbi:MAG: polyprenyl synthetase family protein [Prevotellaceae bacterium]|jgi:octaprenyl-diphosphate synthase|nr:polyprenyl synthetase family protein [Prevotellaceae bacterium]